jgi:hypothetical protein
VTFDLNIKPMNCQHIANNLNLADRSIVLTRTLSSAVELKPSRPSERASESEADGNEQDDTFATRFVIRLLKYLCQGFQAKDKVVRFRVIQIISEIISYLGEIE